MEFTLIIIYRSPIASSHAVLGYICDGVYKVFDSSAGLTWNFDWTKLLSDKSYKDEFLEKFTNLFRTTGDPYKRISLISVYLKKSIKDKYKDISVSSLCEKV